MHAEHCTLRKINDRGGEHGTIYTAVTDAEGPPLQFADRQAVGPDLFRIVIDRPLDLMRLHHLGVAQHRDNQSFLGADGNTDITVMVTNDIIAYNS